MGVRTTTGVRLLPFLLLVACAPPGRAAVDGGYAVVVSKATAADPGWKPVVDALVAKYPGAAVVTYDKDVADAVPDLKSKFPRYACFVARPEEATQPFVAAVHR